uniref:Fibronectin type-III domain-containing protein n=1 Tax=Lates calcarifer TaxID=8187 RepID=A0A4W6C0X3_LATCA
MQHYSSPELNAPAPDTLMIPASSKAFLVTNLVSGTRYDLCVLAAWDDTATTLTATNVVGCTHFFTQDDYPQCQSLPSQLLGGTMILVVGGIIVATLLVFIVILMVRYKAADTEPPVGKLTSVSDTHSQTNGGRLGQNGLFISQPQPQPQPQTKVKAKVTLQDEVWLPHKIFYCKFTFFTVTYRCS